ncbi:MAG TPA: ankyrin repeat domain-containing protein [Patescibacteria group bacterium]|nr:ankyrin repeat domain-containing protein [Patescibacteria group bacterium]
MAKKAFNQSAEPSARQLENFWRAAVEGNDGLVSRFVKKFGVEHLDDKFNNNQKTALMYAATYEHPDVAQALIDGGAKVNVASGGTTALDWALMSRSIKTLEVLVNAGADVNRKNFLGSFALIMAMDLPYSFADSNPEAATRNDSLRAAELLVKAGAKLDAVDSRGRTARDIAAEKGRTELVAFLDKAADEQNKRKPAPKAKRAAPSR